MFTVYSEAVQGFFRRLKWLGRPVPVVYAGPDRAHGQMKKYLASRMGSSTGKKIEELIKEIDEAKIPRPFIRWSSAFSPSPCLAYANPRLLWDRPTPSA